MASVKKALGVPRDIDFVSISSVVYNALMEDIMRNLEVGLPELLEDGFKMLVYVGEYDYFCNWIGKTLSC
ncbi:putative carboxypeptidase C [Helianthus debilis subsp. tardiflorus]